MEWIPRVKGKTKQNKNNPENEVAQLRSTQIDKGSSYREFELPWVENKWPEISKNDDPVYLPEPSNIVDKCVVSGKRVGGSCCTLKWQANQAGLLRQFSIYCVPIWRTSAMWWWQASPRRCMGKVCMVHAHCTSRETKSLLTFWKKELSGKAWWNEVEL